MQPVSSNKTLNQPTNPIIVQSPIVVLFKQVMAKAFQVGLASGLIGSAFYAYYRPLVTVLKSQSLITNSMLFGAVTMTTVLSIGLIIGVIKACCLCLQKKSKMDAAKPPENAKAQPDSKEITANGQVSQTEQQSGSANLPNIAVQQQPEKPANQSAKTEAETVQQSGSANKSNESEKKESKEEAKGEDELIKKMQISDEKERARQVIEHINSMNAACMSANFLDESIQKRTQEVFDLLETSYLKYDELTDGSSKSFRLIALHFYKKYLQTSEPVLLAKASQFALGLELLMDIELVHICLLYKSSQKINDRTTDSMMGLKQQLDGLAKSDDIKNLFLFAECYYILASYNTRRGKRFAKLISNLLEASNHWLNEYSKHVKQGNQSELAKIKEMKDKINSLQKPVAGNIPQTNK